MRATAILVLSYRIDLGTPPKNVNARACPSQNASVVSAGYATTKQASECGRSNAKKWILRSTPPMIPIASPKSACACPGWCASGTNISSDRCRQSANVILHNRHTAREAMLIAQPLKNPLRCVLLLPRLPLVRGQDHVDDPNEWPKLG